MTQSYFAFIPGLDSLSRVYFSGKSAPWNGTGTPWDTVTTSPIELAMNDVTGQKWTPTAAQALVQYEGGPPFSNGQRPRVFAYPNVTETLTLQLRASGTDTECYRRCSYLKHLLHQTLNTATFEQPAIMEMNLHNSGVPFYYEVYRAEIQEDARFLHDEAGRGLMRITVLITRAPHASLSTVTGDLSSVTFTNNGAASDNYSMTIGGELAREGQPMNVYLSGGALNTAGIKNIWLAVVKTARNTTRADAISTSSSSGVAVGSNVSYGIYPDNALCTRLVARVASPTSTLRLRAIATWPGGATLFQSDWLAPSSTSGAFFDFGWIDLAPAVRRAAGVATVSITVTIQAKSTSGTATGTLSWIGCIDYYTWCKATSPSVASSTTFSTTGAAGTGLAGAVAIVPPFVAAGAAYANNMETYGTPPIAYESSALFVIWDAAGVHTNTDTITVSTEYLQLYRTFAGDGSI